MTSHAFPPGGCYHSKRMSGAALILVKIASLWQKFDGNDGQWIVPENINDAMNNTYIPIEMLHSYIAAASTIEDNAENGNNNICQIICRFGEESFNYMHVPHVMQQVLPCYTACFVPLRKQSIHRDIIPCATIWYYQTWLDRLMILIRIYETSLQRCRVFRIM